MNEEHQQKHTQASFFDGGAKTLFYTGLAIGVAGTLVVVLAYMLFGGAKFATSAKTVVQQPSTAVAPDAGNALPPAGPVAAVDPGEHIRGSADATVTMIEYSDFECPYCNRHAPSLAQALKEFPNDVRLVYRHYPLSAIHPDAEKAAEASECVTDQGGNDGFWDFHDRVFAAQDAGLSTDVFKKIAGDMGLDQKKFDSCLDSGEKASVVASFTASGNDAGVQGTPATFINGSLISGAVPYATLKAALQAAGAKS